MYDQYWTKFHSEEHGGFDIVASWNYEDCPISHCFDDSCHDIKDLERQVNNGDLQWFILRVQVFLNGAELGCDYLGGCMYERVEDVLTDGTYEDIRYQAITEAEKWLTTVYKERKLIEYTVNKLQEGA